VFGRIGTWFVVVVAFFGAKVSERPQWVEVGNPLFTVSHVNCNSSRKPEVRIHS
jgi:hypothetical protein